MFSIFKSKPKLAELIPEGLVDIHSHILPGIDDGAKNISESSELLLRLNKIGFSKCIVTPHTMPEIWDNTAKGITESFENTKLNLEKPLDKMLHGVASEYMINETFLERLQTEPLLTLKDNYVLIEMSYMNPPLALKEIIFEIQLKGYQPVLAHPERYSFYHNNTKIYETLKKMEVKFQLNLLSSVGYYGSAVAKTAELLINGDFIDFVGSDVHHLKHIRAFDSKIIIKSEKKFQEAIKKNSFFL